MIDEGFVIFRPYKSLMKAFVSMVAASRFVTGRLSTLSDLNVLLIMKAFVKSFEAVVASRRFATVRPSCRWVCLLRFS